MPFVCDRGFLLCSGSSEVSSTLHAEGVKLESREMNIFVRRRFFKTWMNYLFYSIGFFSSSALHRTLRIFNANWIDNELYPT